MMKKRIVFAVLIAIVLGLAAWRFWPMRFSSIAGTKQSAVTEFSAYAMVPGIENGKPKNDTYRIDGKDLAPIWEILDDGRYQQDLRNLLPWGVDGVSSESSMSAGLLLATGNGKDDYLYISFVGESIVTVSTGGDSGLRIYHPTDPDILQALVQYLQTHGTE